MGTRDIEAALPEGIIPVYVRITGPKAQRTVRMALDTGASMTLIPPEKVLGAGYAIPASQEGLTKIFTASGIEYAPVVKVASLSCLGTTVNNVKVVCHALPPDCPVEGLLGLDFLRRLPAFVRFYREIRSILR